MVTTLAPCEVPKPDPEIVTAVPAAHDSATRLFLIGCYAMSPGRVQLTCVIVQVDVWLDERLPLEAVSVT